MSEKNGTLLMSAALVLFGLAAIVAVIIFAPAHVATAIQIALPVVAAGVAILQAAYNISRGIAKSGQDKTTVPAAAPVPSSTPEVKP